MGISTTPMFAYMASMILLGGCGKNVPAGPTILISESRGAALNPGMTLNARAVIGYKETVTGLHAKEEPFYAVILIQDNTEGRWLAGSGTSTAEYMDQGGIWRQTIQGKAYHRETVLDYKAHTITFNGKAFNLSEGDVFTVVLKASGDQVVTGQYRNTLPYDSSLETTVAHLGEHYSGISSFLKASK